MGKVKITFGLPEHGWLPTTFNYGEYKLDIVISDVPINPITQQCNAIIQILKGIDDPELILWHLEPHCYFLKMKKNGTTYKVVIYESENFEDSKKIVFEANGSFESMILPFYRSLMNFHSKGYMSPDWDEPNLDRIDELKRLVKIKKGI